MLQAGILPLCWVIDDGGLIDLSLSIGVHWGWVITTLAGPFLRPSVAGPPWTMACRHTRLLNKTHEHWWSITSTCLQQHVQIRTLLIEVVANPLAIPIQFKTFNVEGFLTHWLCLYAHQYRTNIRGLWVFPFCVGPCKHHILFTITRISSNHGYKKPG